MQIEYTQFERQIKNQLYEMASKKKEAKTINREMHPQSICLNHERSLPFVHFEFPLNIPFLKFPRHSPNLHDKYAE